MPKDKKLLGLSTLENNKFVRSIEIPKKYGVIVLNPDGSNVGSTSSSDGSIEGATVSSGDLGDASTSFLYFDMARSGWKHFTAIMQLVATNVTIEATNYASPAGSADPIVGDKILGTATATDGTGATITSTDLQNIGDGDDALNGLSVKVTEDTTTPANVNEIRLITDYTAGTGVITLDNSLPGAVTNGVTKFEVTDTDPSLTSNTYGQVLVSDAKAHWADITESLAHIALLSDPSEVVIADTAIVFSRIRFKKVTTNATNSAIIEVTRGR